MAKKKTSWGETIQKLFEREEAEREMKKKRKLCPRCHGSGFYLELGDLHRSEGIVPCDRCGKTGTVDD